MTYRELLKLYQEGKLDEIQKREVEQSVEKQEAISEYLYEREEIPGLEALHEEETADSMTQENDAGEEEEQRFVKMIQKTIRRTFLKMGAVIGAGVLAIVLCVIFVLPQVISALYYNPNQVMGRNEETGAITTNRMSLDLAVYSEMFWPGSYRGTINAVSEGYGTYSISIPQGFSYDGRFITVNGKLKYTRIRFYDEETREFWGPAGSAKEAYASIDELDDRAYYIAYGSLNELISYTDFYNWAKDKELDSNLWCAVYTSDEEGYMCNSEHLGMLINPSGSCLDWDRETYPYLCQLDNSNIARWDMAEDEKKMQTHFISLLSYLRDHSEIVKVLNGNEELPYDTMIKSVQLRDEGGISYLYAVPLN